MPNKQMDMCPSYCRSQLLPKAPGDQGSKGSWHSDMGRKLKQLAMLKESGST